MTKKQKEFEELKEKKHKHKSHNCEKNSETCDNEKKYEYDCGSEETEIQEDYLVMAQRIQAEFDNYRKRSAETFKNSKQDGIIEAVGKFLPAIDALQKAKTMIKDKSVLDGIVLIEKEFKNSLKALEIEEIEDEGQYNPEYHNVIAVINDNSLEDGKITDVYQAGYKIKNKIIRYAQVIVNKIKED